MHWCAYVGTLFGFVVSAFVLAGVTFDGRQTRMTITQPQGPLPPGVGAAPIRLPGAPAAGGHAGAEASGGRAPRAPGEGPAHPPDAVPRPEAAGTPTNLSAATKRASTSSSSAPGTTLLAAGLAGRSPTPPASSTLRPVERHQPTNPPEVNAGVGEMLTPGGCAAAFLKPPCDPFNIIAHDLGKWRDGTVQPRQVKGNINAWKHLILGAFRGRVYMAASMRSLKIRPLGRGEAAVLEKLYELASRVELDVEFHLTLGDVPEVPRKPGHVCADEDFVFATASSPEYCDVSFPSGLRPSTNTNFKDPVPYGAKVNKALWRGSSWPAKRCGSWKRSPRVTMVQAAARGSDVIDARLSKAECTQAPPDFCKWLNTQKTDRIPFDAQFKYRFLPTSAPKCTYTGRLQHFLMSNSIVAKFSAGAELAAQPLYGGLQDNVHLLLLRADSWEEQLRDAQRVWRSLAPIPGNAQVYTKWALSKEAQQCYLFELLAGYVRKLAFRPSERGILASMLRQKRTRLEHTSAVAIGGTFLQRTSLEALQLGKDSFRLFTAPAAGQPRSPGEAEAAMRATCQELRARRPAEQVYSTRSRGWVPRGA